ncbi:MAG: MBL fold metallo-hydrolase [Acidiferrobacterales bacterium]
MRLTFSVVVYLAAMVDSYAASLDVQKVTEGVYALVGELGQRSPENLGNNATFGVIITGEGVVLVDSGGTFKGAAQIEKAIRQITDKPVVLIINTGGQDHRWLGNDYFKRQGARIVAAQAAVDDQRARLNDQLLSLERLVGAQGASGTRDVHADQTFERALDLSTGGIKLQIRHPGAAHTPGDSYVWLPQKKVLFSGDIVYVDRMLAVTPVSRSASWIRAFEQMALLNPQYIVPGHGSVTTLEKAQADTYDYLVMLRETVGELLNRGIGMEDVGKIDQSGFRHLKFYDQLKGRNAQQVYQEMEWE